MKTQIKIFLFYTLSSWVLGSVIYTFLILIGFSRFIFGAVYGMFLYHHEHPYQYILVVAVAYGLCATVWIRLFCDTHGWRRFLSISVMIPLVFVLAVVPGGVLWGIHDNWGYICMGKILWKELAWAANASIDFGWIIVLSSIPYNVLCVIMGYLLTHFGQNYLMKKGWVT
ncbi:MAG: hypothetical protein D6B27_00255 [Gammaproteobacteria bacterium]|nr:MAG: hypothetical protein D6B27_00255 [Gammaproteobacteria bacterium]